MKSTSGTVTVSSSGDMSQATLTSGIVDVRGSTSQALQAVWTGAPVGTLQLQGALGYPTTPSAGGTSPAAWANAVWTNVGTPVAVNGAGNTVWDITSTALAALQVVYTKTSGTGTLVITTNEKA